MHVDPSALFSRVCSLSKFCLLKVVLEIVDVMSLWVSRSSSGSLRGALRVHPHILEAWMASGYIPFSLPPTSGYFPVDCVIVSNAAPLGRHLAKEYFLVFPRGLLTPGVHVLELRSP